jgi:MFS family permease
MLVARILQGASAAVVWTVLAITVMTDHTGTKGLGQAMGYVAIARSVGIAIGPLLGGVVYARAGYYAVYAMVFAFLVFDIISRLVLIEARVAKKRDPCIAPFDGEVEMRTVEDSNAKANTTSIIATDAAVPQLRNQKPSWDV